MRGWGLNEWVAVASALIAIASFVFNWIVVRRQTALQTEALKAQMDSDVMAWGSECIQAFTRAAWLSKSYGKMSAEDFERHRTVTLSEISGLADKGRLFFPNNLRKGGRGDGVSRAFRGGRPFVLNPLVFCCHALEQMKPEDEEDAGEVQFFVDCRREFVSELQHYLDPRRRQEELRRLGLASSQSKEESFADSLKLAVALESLYPGVLKQNGDEGWARNVTRAQSGERRKA
ncbi:MAG TPA: hypothetical protein VG943_03645 [Caulobacterales bacterium]|nr:hypothetical protein [Caulobacterales bacterium]